MKKSIILLCFIALTLVVNAQNKMHKKLQFNLGGAITNYTPAAYIGADWGLFEDLSIGLEGSYRTYIPITVKSNLFNSQININYHFNSLFKLKDPNIDWYMGVQYNYLMFKYAEQFKDRNMEKHYPGLQMGLRYFLTQDFAIYSELSGGSKDGAQGMFKLGGTLRL